MFGAGSLLPGGRNWEARRCWRVEGEVSWMRQLNATTCGLVSAYRVSCLFFHGVVGNDALAGEDEMEQEDGSEERRPVQRRG